MFYIFEDFKYHVIFVVFSPFFILIPLHVCLTCFYIFEDFKYHVFLDFLVFSIF